MVARWDPLKDHENLIQALKIVKDKCPYYWKIMLIGPNMIKDNSKLKNISNFSNISDNVILIGPQENIIPYYNAMDINILSSLGEAFPNVLAESMLCGTPCISTDVGDASEIIGDSGWIVPSKNSKALADAILVAIDTYKKEPKKWNNYKNESNLRISNKYNIDKMIIDYNNVWIDVKS